MPYGDGIKSIINGHVDGGKSRTMPRQAVFYYSKHLSKILQNKTKDNGNFQNRHGSIQHVGKGACVSSRVHSTIQGTGEHN